MAGKVDPVVRAAVVRYQIPGASVAVVKNGQLVYSQGYGFQNRERRIAATAGTQYQIASVTKEFVAALIMRLAARHELSLNDSVTKFFPFFGNARGVTIRDLLDQRSGIPDYNKPWMLLPAVPHMHGWHFAELSLIRAVALRHLWSPPGLQFRYSNANYIMLGLIAEQVTHKPLRTLLRDELFVPLKMNRTFLGTAGACSTAACGYFKSPVGILPTKGWQPELTWAAGGLTSTVDDLAKWDIALMNGKVLSANQFAQMSSPDPGTRYAYGLFEYREGARRIVWHDGTTLGFRSMNSMILPDRDAVIVLANADYSHAPVIAMQIEKAVFALPGGSGEKLDPGLPRFSYPIAAICALLPLLALLIWRRHLWWVVLFAVAAYASGLYFWPAGIACALIGIAIAIGLRRVIPVSACLLLVACAHFRWPAKTLVDGVALSAHSERATIAYLISLPRPAGAEWYNDSRVPAETKVYVVNARLLRFTHASDGDIHLAIADPHNDKTTMIAEIPDPARMTGAPVKYINEVATARDTFVRNFGEPAKGWHETNALVEIEGPAFFDIIHGQVGGLFGGVPSGVEIHPVLRLKVQKTP